jgi:hypothetical protein
MLELPFEAATFDAVLEKGTMDVLFVDNDSSWDPRPEVRERVTRFLDGVHRHAHSAAAHRLLLCTKGIHKVVQIHA